MFRKPGFFRQIPTTLIFLITRFIDTMKYLETADMAVSRSISITVFSHTQLNLHADLQVVASTFFLNGRNID